jgi:hypothetical protein
LPQVHASVALTWGKRKEKRVATPSPTINWILENWKHDYYAIDQAALILHLRALGNTRADLITTSGKGHNPDGKRNPHSWTIVDEEELARWIHAILNRQL